MADKAVQKQWEAPATGSFAFAMEAGFISLLKATTQDDVQAAAVDALEKIGIRCLVKPQLISRAIDALNGNENIRIGATKLLFGIARGGTALEIRKSTARVQAFLLISSLVNCCLTPKEIGEILFEILAASGDLGNTAASTTQLTGLIKVLSGHCQAVLSTDGVDVMSSSMKIFAGLREELQLTAALETLWSNVSPKDWGDLLWKSMDAIRNDDIHRIHLAGSHGAIWITAVFLWLNGGEIAVVYQNKILWGEINAKIRILLEFDADLHARPTGQLDERYSWQVKAWKKGMSLPDLVYPNSRKELDIMPRNRRINYTPLRMILPAVTLREHYRSSSKSEAEVEVLGGLAAAILDTTLRLGKIAQLGGNHGSKAPRDFCSVAAMHRLNKILRIFGWSASANQGVNKGPHWTNIRNELSQKAGSHHDLRGIEKVYRAYLIKYFRDPWESAKTEKMMESAQTIAMQALMVLFVYTPALKRDSNSNDTVLDEQLLRRLPIDLNFGRGLYFKLHGQNLGLARNTPPDLVQFRLSIFQFVNCGEALSMRTEDTSKLVAISGRGIAALLGPILHHNPTLEGLLDVVVLPGNIYFGNKRFEIVRVD